MLRVGSAEEDHCGEAQLQTAAAQSAGLELGGGSRQEGGCAQQRQGARQLPHAPHHEHRERGEDRRGQPGREAASVAQGRSVDQRQACRCEQGQRGQVGEHYCPTRWHEFGSERRRERAAPGAASGQWHDDVLQPEDLEVGREVWVQQLPQQPARGGRCDGLPVQVGLATLQAEQRRRREQSRKGDRQPAARVKQAVQAGTDEQGAQAGSPRCEQGEDQQREGERPRVWAAHGQPHRERWADGAQPQQQRRRQGSAPLPQDRGEHGDHRYLSQKGAELPGADHVQPGQGHEQHVEEEFLVGKVLGEQ